MTATYGYRRRVVSLWLAAWPILALLLFAAVAALRAVLGGYARAVLVLPIVLLIPGSLTVAAIFGDRDRPRGMLFWGYAALLSVLWSAFISLVLYILHILITATTTYFGMLVLCIILAIATQARLVAERTTADRAAMDIADRADRERPGTRYAREARGDTPRFASLIVIVAGVNLLAGTVFFYDHLPRPTPPGYTQLAWASTQAGNPISVGPGGVKLDFKIVHQQSSQERFRLNATWDGSPTQPLAEPLSFSIGPDKTFRGDVLIPPPSNGCAHRVVITLAGIDQGRDATWSINANVYRAAESRKACTL